MSVFSLLLKSELGKGWIKCWGSHCPSPHIILLRLQDFLLLLPSIYRIITSHSSLVWLLCPFFVDIRVNVVLKGGDSAYSNWWASTFSQEEMRQLRRRKMEKILRWMLCGPFFLNKTIAHILIQEETWIFIIYSQTTKDWMRLVGGDFRRWPNSGCWQDSTHWNINFTPKA